jgi:hypothetical protein
MPAMNRRATVAALVAALLLALAACGGSSPSSSPSATPSPAPTASPSPTPGLSPTPGSSGDTSAVFREIEDQVIAERGLEAKQRPVPILISATEARARLESHYRERNSAEEVAVAEETLKALGLLPADASLDDLYLELLGAQAVAFYETDTDQLFVISRSGGIGPSEKVYFSHEFTHALQDQHFDAGTIFGDAVGQGDRSLARLAFVEGDASLLMARWMGTHLSPAELGELLVVDPEAQATLERMPAILRETLTFPYLQGLILANGIWADGGWEAIDRAYGRLPESTEQVLHPEKYAAGEKPVAVPLDAAALAGSMGAGWSGTREDTLGELQRSIWLRENGVQAQSAADAAAGWGGDRLAYLRGPDGAYALVLRTAWDSPADAAEFVDRAGTVVGDGDSPGTVVRSSATEVVVVLASDGAALNAAVDAAGLNLPD